MKGARNWDLFSISRSLLAFTFLGMFAVVSVWWDRWSVALLWACASGAVAFIVGFLFGFPRTIAQPVSTAGSPSGGSAPGATTATDVSVLSRNRESRLTVNTNLEQVSDWITKTIVGVGLVELRSLPRRFGELATYASATLGKPVTGSAAEAAAAALIAYFAVLGFLGGYLITRMFFQGAFDRADRADPQVEEDVAKVRSLPLLRAIGNDPSSAETMASGISAAAERLKDIPLDEAAAQGADSAVVARANLLAGNANSAVAAYLDAIAKAPWDPRLRLEYASALRDAQWSGSLVISALRDARALESQKPNLDVRRKIYQSLTYMCLYEPQPQGFTDAILYGEEYTQNASNLPSATIWVNLAAAYGQQAGWLKSRGEDFASVRNKALNAVERAVRLGDPSDKAILVSLLEPSHEQAAQGEDDLAVFQQDDAFRKILDLPAK